MEFNQYTSKGVVLDSEIFLYQSPVDGVYYKATKAEVLAGISSGGGSGATNWTFKNDNYTATPGDRIIVDTSLGSWLLTLPPIPGFGTEVEIYGVKGLTTSRLNIDFNQSKYKNNVAVSGFYNSLYNPTKLVYIDSVIGWLDTANLITALSAYLDEILKDANYLYLRLGESSGTVANDSSGNNRPGTYRGTPTLGSPGSLSSDSNTAVIFNGTNSYVSLPYLIAAPSIYTIECRFKTSAANGSLFGFSGTELTGSGSFDRELYLSAGKIRTNHFGGHVYTSPLSYNDNVWHTITSVLAPGVTEIWLDNTLIGSSANGNAAGYNGYWHIGYSVTGGFFNGLIDEPSISHTRISQARIQARHSAAN